MNHNVIAKELSRLAHELSYTPYCVASDGIDESVQLYPAACIMPPEIVAVSGRDEGEICYRIKMQLMQITASPTTKQKEKLWEQMRTDAMHIITSLPLAEDVREVKNVRCTTAQFSLTPHGEVSVEISMEVTIHFFRIPDQADN